MSFQQFTRSRRHSAFSALAKSLVTVSLLAGSSAIGSMPTRAATSLSWDGNSAEACVEVLGGGLLVLSDRTYVGDDLYRPTVTYTEGGSGVVFDFVIDPMLLDPVDGTNGKLGTRFESVAACPFEPGITPGVANRMACFSVSSTAPGALEFSNGSGLTPEVRELDTEYEVIQDDPSERLLFLTLTFSTLPTSSFLISYTLGTGAGNCGGDAGDGDDNDGGDENESDRDSRFDPNIDIDHYRRMAEPRENALPDTL